MVGFLDSLKIIDHSGRINFAKYTTDERQRMRPKNSYVVLSYGAISSVSDRTNSRKVVRIHFLNITNDCNYELTIQLPIECLSQLPIGSIWVDGKSQQKYTSGIYDALINENATNVEYLCMASSKDARIQLLKQQFSVTTYDYDHNDWMAIKDENDKTVLMHPWLFFNATYGASKEINRILITYPWGNDTSQSMRTVSSLLHLDYKSSQAPSPALITGRLAIQDGIFLHYLKNEDYTWRMVKDLNKNILDKLQKKSKSFLHVEPYHQQRTLIRFNGIQLDENTILCTEILGVSQPTGQPIECDVFRDRKNENGPHSDGEVIQLQLSPLYHNLELDEVLLADTEVNNPTTAVIRQPVMNLDRIRKLIVNHISLENHLKSGNRIVLPNDLVTQFSTGESYGSLGLTGLLNVLNDYNYFEDAGINSVCDTNQLSSQSQYCRLLTHALKLKPLGAQVCCFTFENHNMGEVVSYMQFNRTSFPTSVYVLRITYQDSLYYILDCVPSNDRRTQSSAGIIIQVNDETKFLTHENPYGLRQFINSLAINYGKLSKGILSSFDNGKIASFNHRYSDDNNWVLNGILNLQY